MERETNVRSQIRTNIGKRKNNVDKIMPRFFFLMASVSVVTTLGIVLTLITDAAKFFKEVSIFEFFGSKLAPLAAQPSFGILPLITGTILSSLIAMLVAIPVGLTAAMYMSEFASARARKV